MQGTEGWSPQVPEPSASILVLLRPQELGSKQGPRAGGSHSRRWTGEGAKSGGVSSPTQHLDFPTSVSRRCSAGNARHLWATGGMCVRLLGKWVAWLEFHSSQGPHQYTKQAALANSPRSAFPSSNFHANLVVPLDTTTNSKYLLSTYLCTVLCSGFRRHRRNRTGKPPCPSRVYGLGEDRRGRDHEAGGHCWWG